MLEVSTVHNICLGGRAKADHALMLDTMNMRNSTLYGVCLGFALTACGPVTPERISDADSESPPDRTASADQSLEVIELSGGHDSVCGRWRVVVSAENGSLHLSLIAGIGSPHTFSAEHWTAAEGAFLFVEGDPSSEERVWAYDGVQNLVMLKATPDQIG